MQKVCVPVCIRMHTAFLRTASVPADIWFPPVKGSGRERSLEVQNPTANFISRSWWTPRILLLFCRQAVHTADIPFPLCAVAEESIAAPRRSRPVSLLCHPSKETAIETHDHEAFEFASVFLLALRLRDRVTLKAHNEGRARGCACPC